METVREKLNKLIKEAEEKCDSIRCNKCDFIGELRCESINIADYLIQNGVTIATDTNDGDKWVSVDDRLPEDRFPKLACSSSGRIIIAEYNDHVLPWTRKPIGWGYSYQNGYIDFGNEHITHWMPLPAVPKEVQ